MVVSVASSRLPKLPVIDNFAARTQLAAEAVLRSVNGIKPSALPEPAKSDTILAGCLWALIEAVEVPKGTTLWNGDVLKHDLKLRPGACLMARRYDEEHVKVRIPVPNGLFELWGAQVEVLFSELHMFKALHQERLEPLQRIQQCLVNFSTMSKRQREKVHAGAVAVKAGLKRTRNNENRTALTKIPDNKIWEIGQRNNPSAGLAVLQSVLNPLKRREKQIAAIRLNYMVRERAVLEELSNIRRIYDEIVERIGDWPKSSQFPDRHDLINLRHYVGCFTGTFERTLRGHPRQPFVQNMQLCLEDCHTLHAALDDLIEHVDDVPHHVDQTFTNLQVARRRLVLGARAARLMFENEILVMVLRTWRASRLRPESRIAVPVNMPRFFARVAKLRWHLAQVDDRELRKPFKESCLTCFDAALALQHVRPGTIKEWREHFTKLMWTLKGVTHLLGFPEVDLNRIVEPVV